MRRLVLSPTIANFVIAYGVTSGAGPSPASEAVFTMCPSPRSTMCG
jgi:hypothetical protein